MLLASGTTEIAQVARMSPHADEPECKGYEVSCIFVEREGPTMPHPPQSRWQQKVFEDVLKERLYQDRQWGPDVDDTLNTPWMWCAYLCGYATKWMKNPHRWTREDTEEFYDRMIETSAIAAAAAESVLRQRDSRGKTFYESE